MDLLCRNVGQPNAGKSILMRWHCLLFFAGGLFVASPAHAMGRTARVAIEAGGGVAGAVTGALAVGGLAWAVTPSENRDCHGYFCLDADESAGLFGGLLGGVAGLGTGVFVAGHASGGDGAYWSAMAGEGVGFAASASLFGLAWLCDETEIDPCSDVAEPLAIVGLFTLPLAGAIVGYEWNSEARRASATRAALSQAMLGWSGRF
jgi:hypothetical protein